ncbi:GDSL-type esterase/lipase family protein [Streptomyces sp. bgisy091]|uniref:GDSL-type esterase/lipase family protein n=1 Tax=Streptomyces sp. bgisy091 TaxID=3413778 RepID=UPI003D717820
MSAAAGLLASPASAQADDDITVYLAGDSTMQTYDPYWVPQAGWGQELGRYLSDDVTVENHAIGGRSSRTFVEEGRLDAILDKIEPGDYLFVQFGHNDASVSRPERYTSPADYKEFLRNDYIEGARERGATPVVVTPVSRRSYNSTTGEFNVSFPEYVEAAKAVAAEEDVPLVDLSASSRAYLNTIGPEEAKSVFLHVPAGVYPNRPNGTADDTHFQEYGAIQMARLVADDVSDLNTPLARHIVNSRPPKRVPRKPQAVTARTVTNEGARLTWDAVEGADIYRIQKKKHVEGAEFTLATTSTIPQAEVAGLKEGTAYELRVVAVNGAGESAPSRKTGITTRVPERRYDFGPAGGSVLAGFTEVSPQTLYTADRGYGFTDATGLFTRDRGSALDAMQRDFVALFGGQYEFSADTPDGVYAVTAYVGDRLGSARTNFALEGEDRGGLSSSGSVVKRTFADVVVKDGRLNVTVSGQTAHLNGLELTRIGNLL